MRDIARIQKNTMYNTGFTKLTIVVCAIGGIILGSLFFKLSNFQFNLGTATSDSKDQSAFSESTTKFEKDMETLFKVFGIDFYNPITILNNGYPYFERFYNDNYLEYVAEKEKEELDKKVVSEVQDVNEIQTPEDTEPKPEPFKEASSSITFEGDVEQSEEENNPIVSSGKIKIINQTKYSIDINKFLTEPLKLKADKVGPKILVYHTHTTESFLKSINELNKKNIASRSSDNQYNVVRVGEALISNFKKYNIDVLHNKTVHDKDYNNSYLESLKTLTSNVKKYPSLKMTIDLHRDAVSGQKLRVVKEIGGKNVAQIMFVIGTDSKLTNPQWKENLKLAIKLQERLNEICPGLAKPIYISQNRYNQHLTNGSIIVEIGGDGNVIDECVRSTSYLAQAINDVVYKNK
jgi:stage II sporulation protein P